MKVVRSVVSSPKAISALSLWAFGIFVCLYAAAPYPTTEGDRELFQKMIHKAQSIPGLDDARFECEQAQMQTYNAKGWFWWASSAESAKVNQFQELEAQACSVLGAKLKEQEEIKRDAFSIVGLWSEFGVSEARQLFWDCIERGKGFAKRATFWDMLFGVAMGRDENMAGFLVRVVLNFVINVTWGLIMAIIGFMWYLWGLVVLYKASFWSGMAFFTVATFAGLSMAMVYIFVVYGTVASAGYVLVYQASKAAIQQNGQRGGAGHRQQHLRGARPHYE